MAACVCGKTSEFRCGACGTVNYCSRECQKTHWPTHKPECVREVKIMARIKEIRKNIDGTLAIRCANWSRTVIDFPSTIDDFLTNSFHITRVHSDNNGTGMIFKFLDASRTIPAGFDNDFLATITSPPPDNPKMLCVELV